MKRTPLRRTGALKRGARLERRTRIRQVNPQRAARAEREKFGAPARVARALPCCVRTCRRAAPSHAAHFIKRSGGGKARHVVPLCPPHHRAQEGRTLAFQLEHARMDEDGGLVGGFLVAGVVCATLEEVASYIADLVRDHVCADTPEVAKGRKRPRCYVCRARLKPSALEDLTP